MTDASSFAPTGAPPKRLRFADLTSAHANVVQPRVLRRVVALAAPYWPRLALATVATLGAAVVSLALPHMLGRAVDQAHAIAGASGGARDWAPLASSAAMVLILGLLRGALLMTSGYQGENVGQRVGYDLRIAFFDKLQQLGFAFHDRVHTGELITRGMLDLEGCAALPSRGCSGWCCWSCCWGWAPR